MFYEPFIFCFTAPCPAGEFLANDGTCDPCPVGYYRPDDNSIVNCTQCPVNYTTEATGSDSLTDCVCK